MDPYRTPFPDVAELAWIFADGLTGVAADGSPTPRLASRVPTRENGDVDATSTTFTYHLRSDARWHDGKPFTAHDVSAVFADLLASHPSWKNMPPYSNVRSIVAVDATTLRVHLHHADPSFARLFFAAYGAFPIPIYRRVGTRLIGTSPYRMQSTSIARTTFVRTSRGGPFDRISVVPYADAPATGLAVKAGEVDVAMPMDRTVGRAEHLTMVGRNAGAVYVFANTTGALRDPAARRYVLDAIDTKTIAARVFHAQPTNTLLPGVDIAFDAPAKPPSLPTIRMLYAKAPAIEKIALLIADSLQHHGIATSLAGVTLQQAAAQMRAGGYDLSIDSNPYAVPSDLAAEWSCANVAPMGANDARLCDPKLDAAMSADDAAGVARRFDEDAAVRPVVAYEQYAAVGSRLTMAPIPPLAPWFAAVDSWTLR